MIHRIPILVLIFFLFFYFSRSGFVQSVGVLGVQQVRSEDNDKEDEIGFPNTGYSPGVSTTTAFDQKEVVESETIPYETNYIDDEDLEYGKERVEVEGINGLNTYTYLVTHWLDDEIDRMLISTASEPPVTEVVSKGKKIVWKEIDTPDFGTIRYWYKMEVFATSYDSTCLGCNNTTALGAPVKQGVCAVDPKVISMYTHFYVPGYGRCQALDVGGLIKGNRIDLAFEDLSREEWWARDVEIYLMDNPPE